MKLNHNFCVAANKVISRSPIASYYTDLKSMDSSSYETVELYMDALKEMVIYHNELLRSGKFDNNQLLRFNSIANKLLKGYSNGVIPRLPNHLPTIETKNMGLLNTIKSWLAPEKPEVIDESPLAKIEAKLAQTKAEKDALDAETAQTRKERTQKVKQANRINAGIGQLKSMQVEYVKSVSAARVAKAELESAEDYLTEMELEADRVLASFDFDLTAMINALDEEAPAPTRSSVTERKETKTTIKEDLWEETEDTVTSSVSEPKAKVIIPSVLKEEETKETKETESKGGKETKTGKSRKGTRSRKSFDSAVKSTTKVEKGGKETKETWEGWTAGDSNEEGSEVASCDAIEDLDFDNV